MGVQDNLGQFFYEKIMPALEKVLDQYGDPKKTLVIDRLELDCGIIPAENWEKVFYQRILNQVEEELKSPKKSNPVSVSMEDKANEVFFFFLRKGFFPWNSPFSNPKGLEKDIVIGSAFLEDLKNSFQRSSVFSERLFKSFSAEFISAIFDSLTQKSNPKIGELVKHLHSKPSVQKELMQVLLKTFQNQSRVSVDSIFRTLLSNFSMENLPYLAEYLGRVMVREKEIGLGLKSLLSEPMTPENREKLLLVMKIIQKDPKILGKSGINLNEIDSERSDSALENDFEKSQSAYDSFEKNEDQENPNTSAIQWSPDQIDPEDEIFIENAGLVLLHPFLEVLFSNLHLTANRKFVSIHDQFIAAKILQFLVFGENDHTENFYPLDKILCGIGLTQVLDLDRELSQESKTESEQLLKEVIGHWSVLKNTSLEGLRETFLHRNGKISRVNKGWKLQVERKTVDVLLSKLPWGMGIIKLPWMTEMIFVDWE